MPDGSIACCRHASGAEQGGPSLQAERGPGGTQAGGFHICPGALLIQEGSGADGAGHGQSHKRGLRR